MKINYKLSRDGLTIKTSPRGVLDLERTIDYFDRLACDDRIKANAVEIVDLRQVSKFLISNNESGQITRGYQKPKELKRIRATVFLSETPLAYGISRMLQTFHELENPNHVVLVARSGKELNGILKEIKT